jgi:hypothetical protein
MKTNIITQGRAKVVGPESKTSLRKSTIVLATAAALTGGLTADAFADGYPYYNPYSCNLSAH